MSWKCRVFDHKLAEFTDSGYAICQRCGSHAFYNEEQWRSTYSLHGILLLAVTRLRWKYERIVSRVRMFLHPGELPF